MPTYSLRINGRTRQVEGEPDDNLLAVLRYELDLTGSKFGCGEGFCGACTVLVDNQATRACVTRLAAIGAAGAIRNHGLRVGADVSLIGFNNIALTAELHVPLTSIESHAFDMGRDAGQLLADVLAGRPAGQRRTEPVLLVRESTCEAPHSNVK